MAEAFRNDSEIDLLLAAELMASVDFDTLDGGRGGGDDAVDRSQQPHRDEIDPGSLLATVHAGSHTPLFASGGGSH